MTPEQEKKFKESFEMYRLDTITRFANAEDLARYFWECCLDANGIGKEEKKPTFEDTCRAFESLAYSITKVSDKLTEAINRGVEKANSEKVAHTVKEWTPKDNEPVFVLAKSGQIYVGKYVNEGPRKDGDPRVQIQPNSWVCEWVALKPFIASSIGKRWEEI